MKKITIAIDGYSSCGKSTMAKDLAKEIGYVYVDTGAMYRSVTLYALEHGIADIVIDPLTEDVCSIVGGLTEGRGADVVMEVAGGKGTFEMAWRVARTHATVTIVAMYPESQTLPLPDMYGKNLTFKTGGVDGCHCQEIMGLIAEGRLDPSALITDEFPFDRVMDAYDLFSSGSEGVMKVLLRM